VDLGVTAVELLPVAQFPGRHGWGYDGVDLFAPHEAYGGPEGLVRLVDACHARGLGVVLDVVYNHLGPDGNHLRRFGPYFTDRYHTPWGDAVNLDDAGSDEVREFFLANACQWLRDYHVDGLRIDAVHAFFDRSAVHFLEELAVRVDALSHQVGRPLWLIPESDLNDPRLVRSREAGGFGLHASWSDDFHHALHAALTGERDGYYEDFGGLAPVARALERVYVYDGAYSAHRGRRHGRRATGLPGTRFVGYLQNHDQVGNRARGERTSHLLSTGRLAVGAALVLTAPFVPMLFQGEEWAASTPFPYFCDHEDPELARAVRDGRRREFQAFGWDPETIPDPGDPETFASAKLRWEERERSPHRELLAWHRELIALRRATPALSDGRMDRVRAHADEDAGTLRVERGPLVIAANLSDEPRRIPAGDRNEILATWDGGTKLQDGELRLAPESVAIISSS
jgi:maltooligosyltrehalose trehalohydrolase